MKQGEKTERLPNMFDSVKNSIGKGQAVVLVNLEQIIET